MDIHTGYDRQQDIYAVCGFCKHTVKNQFGYFDMEAYRTSQEQYNEEKG